jgi:glycosyltransferase involved in cell wall biosynthesis
MGDGKAIVLLSGFRIFPASTGGHVRTSSVARALARLGHTVQIFSLAGRQPDYRLGTRWHQPDEVQQIEPNLTEHVHLGLGFGLLQAIGRRLDYPRYWQYHLLDRGIVPRQLRRALDAADIVISDMPWCPPVPGAWAKKPWFLLSHNLEYRLLEQSPPRHRRFASWMRAVESQAPSRFRDIFACAEEDRDFFREHDTRRSLKLPIIRCGVDPTAYEVPPDTRERVRAELGLTDADRLLVFSGSSYAPNVEAAAALRLFCQQQASFLASEKVTILILGSVMPGPLREGAFMATGRVPEVVSYLAAADAGINAVTKGSGSNVKLFEYLAARLPIISTEFGVRGTLLVADTDYLPFAPDQLRPAIERFLRDGDREHWLARATMIWERHRNSCDIQALVRDAVGAIPEFN